MEYKELQLPSNRKFGSFFTVIFLVLSGYFWYVGSEMEASFFTSMAALFAIISFYKAKLLLPLNKLWMSFGFLLGKIVSPLIIGIIFFALFTPIAVVMRLFGRDELRLRFKSKESHWINREISMQPNSFRNQF
jgi:hypothetical protein